MNGRQETTNKIERSIDILLQGKPSILHMYYATLTNKTASTKKQYIKYLIEYFKYLDENGFDTNNIETFKRIKKMDVSAYLMYTRYRIKDGERIENGESIRRSKMFAIQHFYKFLIDNDIIDTNPCSKVELPKLNEDLKIVTLSKPEVDKVKSNIVDNSKHKERDLAIFVLGTRLGLRITSIIEINIGDINFDEMYITVTEKGNKRREVFFGEDTKEVLKKWIRIRGQQETDALFVNSRGKRISYEVPYYMLKKNANGFNKKVTPHKMRSTCASNLYEESDDIYLVADVLGHKNISNTRRYAKISEKKRKRAAAILDNI